MVRYPLGGMLSWVLQYLVGFQRLGHEVWFVEKSGYPNACYDPRHDVMTDDASYGLAVVSDLLAQHEIQHWCFVDQAGRYHGTPRPQIEAAFREADLFLDMGTHGAWMPEAVATRCRVLNDGEPGFTQMRMELRQANGEVLPAYDHYYTTGANIGTPQSTAPTAGQTWRHLFHPVVPALFAVTPLPTRALFSTVMNWQSHARLQYQGKVFGQKDLAFATFMELPGRVAAQMEVAVHGKGVPLERLETEGWQVRDAHQATISVPAFYDHITRATGEFSVCKQVFVATRSGWFSDRSAAYLASGRPVVLQDTGFSAHLPCGDGLFAVTTLDQAEAAIDSILTDPQHHSRRARELAMECLDARRLLGRFLNEIGI